MATDLLAGIPLFAPLPPDERAELEKLLEARSYAALQPIVWIGERGDEFFIIQEGRVAISCPDETGKEVVLGTLGGGQFFGEISLLDGGPRTATARAHTPATLLVLTRDHLLQFIRRHPDAAIHMLTILGQRQRETVDKVRGIRNVNEAVEARRTPLQRAATRVAAVGANELFVVANLAFFGGWIVLNVILWMTGRRHFDEPPTFFTLGFIITLEAILLSMFVLNSQKQQAERDRIRGDLEYQVNLKAHNEVMQLHQKVDRLEAMLKGVKVTDAPPAVQAVDGGAGLLAPAEAGAAEVRGFEVVTGDGGR